MKIPLKPPDIFSSLGDTPAGQRQRVIREGKILAAGAYLHWDQLRHREPPAGLAPEEWWAGTKLARLMAREETPFVQKCGRAFTMVHTAPIRKRLHEIDQTLGMVGPRSDVHDLVDAHGRKYLLANSIVEEAIYSSQLEGAATTRAAAREMVRAGRRPRTRGERMILNHYRANERIEELAREDLTETAVFELHRMLVDGTLDDPEKAGVYRQASDKTVVTLLNSPEDEIAHVPPEASELPERMKRLLAFANGRTPDEWLHPVLRAITLHFMIGYDHPFVDGNGRVARALFYWAMARYGYSLARFLTVSRILREAPARYATAYLHTETDEGDLTYFIDHQLRVITRSIDALRDYVRKKVSEVRTIEDRLRDGGEWNHRQLRLLGHALRHPGFRYTVRSHQTSHGVTTNTARADLHGLAAAGLLALTRRGARHEFLAPHDLELMLDSLERR
ncbi:Fic family protein [Candidatus Palauibacter sp.]|uniref:Fic family protein n=1 Tax=Candidatus Palauibacter sp. TaxID=3101350 RepID=UPI003AF21202